MTRKEIAHLAMAQKLVELFKAGLLAYPVAFGLQCVQPQFAVIWVHECGVKRMVCMMEAEG